MDICRFCVLVFVLAVMLTTCESQHRRNFIPDVKEEHDLTQTIMFKYYAAGHMIGTRVRSRNAECYVYNTTMQERKDVHTEMGQRQIEAKLLQMIITKAEHLPQMSDVDKNALPNSIKSFCGHRKTYRLNN